MKRGHKGVYHKMSGKHMQRYADEFAAKNNLRDLDTLDQMIALVRAMGSRRLTWEELTR